MKLVTAFGLAAAFVGVACMTAPVSADEFTPAQKKELAGVITASWGDQIRSYVLAPYQMVKDLRTEYEVNNPTDVFDGNLDGFINAGIKWRKSAKE